MSLVSLQIAIVSLNLEGKSLPIKLKLL